MNEILQAQQIVKKEKALLNDFNLGPIPDMLEALRLIAMPENWDYSNMEGIRPNPILYNYLIHTYSRLKDEGKIIEKGKFRCFNTGLVTPNQQEIFMLFNQSKTSGIWFYNGFYPESDSKLYSFSPLPDRATYFSESTDLIYNIRYELRINVNHIIDDEANFERFPDEIKCLSKHQLKNTFDGAIEHAKKRIRRNYLTAIPQFYRGLYCPNPGGQLQLLLPLCLIDASKADLALAVYKVTSKEGGADEHFYSGRTCLTLDMAINNARLITKPDDEWLKP